MGPNIDPCGTPWVTLSGEETEVATLVVCSLSDKLTLKPSQGVFRGTKIVKFRQVDRIGQAIKSFA